MPGFFQWQNKTTCCAAPPETAAAQLWDPAPKMTGTCGGCSAALPVLSADENHQQLPGIHFPLKKLASLLTSPSIRAVLKHVGRTCPLQKLGPAGFGAQHHLLHSVSPTSASAAATTGANRSGENVTKRPHHPRKPFTPTSSSLAHPPLQIASKKQAAATEGHKPSEPWACVCVSQSTRSTAEQTKDAHATGQEL